MKKPRIMWVIKRGKEYADDWGNYSGDIYDAEFLKSPNRSHLGEGDKAVPVKVTIEEVK